MKFAKFDIFVRQKSCQCPAHDTTVIQSFPSLCAIQGYLTFLLYMLLLLLMMMMHSTSSLVGDVAFTIVYTQTHTHDFRHFHLFEKVFSTQEKVSNTGPRKWMDFEKVKI